MKIFYDAKPVGDTLLAPFGLTDIDDPINPIPLDTTGYTFTILTPVNGKWKAVSGATVAPATQNMIDTIAHPSKSQMKFYTLTIAGDVNPSSVPSKKRKSYRVRMTDPNGITTPFELQVLEQ
jgi:hypothetical protein